MLLLLLLPLFPLFCRFLLGFCRLTTAGLFAASTAARCSSSTCLLLCHLMSAGNRRLNAWRWPRNTEHCRRQMSDWHHLDLATWAGQENLKEFKLKNALKMPIGLPLAPSRVAHARPAKAAPNFVAFPASTVKE